MAAATGPYGESVAHHNMPGAILDDSVNLDAPSHSRRVRLAETKEWEQRVYAAGRKAPGFCLATPTAIVVGSGWVPIRFMAKYGLLMVVPVVLLFVFVGYPLAVKVFGG